MRFKKVDTTLIQRQEHRESGANTGFAVDIHATAMVLYNPLNDHQAYARTLCFGGVIGFKNVPDIFRCNAGTIVAERHSQKAI